jgi:EmrB/QacA subfamily drug resistance transporter
MQWGGISADTLAKLFARKVIAMSRDGAPGTAILVPPRVKAGPWVVLIVLTLGFFMILLDTTIVYVAIPKIEEGLNTDFDQVLWVINAYMLTYAVLLITAGRLGDLLGPKKLFITGLVLFTLASAACGFSQTGGQLITFRVIQACGGALLTPQTLSVITTLFPPERRGSAFGVWGMVAGISAALGPIVGGYLVTTYDWQAIFFLNVPIGVVAVTAAILLMPEIRFNSHHDFDIIGVALVSVGLFLGIFALVEGQTYSWGTLTPAGSFSVGPTHWGVISIYSLLVYSAIVLAVFVWAETKAREPLLPFALFRDRNFSVANILSLGSSFGLTSMWIPLILLLQTVLGWSPMRAGLTAVPYSLSTMIVAPVAGRLSDRINPRYILMVGFGMSAAGVVVLASALALDDTWWSFVPGLIVAGIGMGCTMVPLTTVAMRDVPPPMAGAASGFINTVRQVGGAVGTAVVGAVLANQVAAELPKQAQRFALQVPITARPKFLAFWLHAGHSAQRFGAGQQIHIQPMPGASAALMRLVIAAARSTFANAFLNGARPALGVVAVVLALGVPGSLVLRRHRLLPEPDEGEVGPPPVRKPQDARPLSEVT